MGLLGEEDETWRVYRAMHGELPCMADVHTYDGFVITGSCSDAHGDDRWINDLVSFLRALDSMKKKVLGVCFGHQILSRALGGKTGRAMKGWDIGVTCIRLSPSAIKLLSSLHIPSHLPIIECHRDEVWQPPPHAEVMACSEKTGVEMFRYGDHMMGIQGHPEYNKDILRHLLDRLLQRNLIQACQAETAKASLEAQEPDREAWKRLCRGFLTGKLSW
ncbi:Homoserine O-succinyltransferase [Musa troglodytarum]|nr:Homoserine O-succinyltransferase [Musa troglodytarum]